MTVANGVLNELAIRRLSKVLSTEGMKAEEPVSKEKFVAFLSDLSDLGYWLNKEAFEVVADLSDDEVAAILEKLAATRGVTGFKSMYLNFPKQVVDMSYFELYFNAVVHYAGDMFGVRITPAQEVKVRNPLDEDVEVTLLGVASEQDLTNLASEIAAQGQPYSQQDKNDLSILADSALCFCEWGLVTLVSKPHFFSKRIKIVASLVENEGNIFIFFCCGK